MITDEDLARKLALYTKPPHPTTKESFSILRELQILRKLQPFTDHKDWCFRQGCTCGLSALLAELEKEKGQA